MPLSKEEHEALLNELLADDLTTSRKTELLQQLRVDYGGVLSDFDQLNQNLTKYKSDNEDLVISNSKLFRELGYTNKEEKPKEVKEKDFSETVTIESLEN